MCLIHQSPFVNQYKTLDLDGCSRGMETSLCLSLRAAPVRVRLRQGLVIRLISALHWAESIDIHNCDGKWRRMILSPR